MINGRKNSLKHGTALILTISALIIITSDLSGNYNTSREFYKPLTAWQQQDTIRPGIVKKDTTLTKDTIPGKDTSITKTDSFQLKISKDTLEAPIHYSASDSMVLDIPNNKIIYYNKAEIKYQNMVCLRKRP